VRGDLARAQDDPGTALRQYETALALARESNNQQWEPHVHVGLGGAALDAGDLDRGHRLLLEGLRLSVELGLRPEQARAVEGLAGWAAAVGQAGLALRLAGAAARYREHAGTPLFPTDQRFLRLTLEPAYRALGAAASVGLERGRAMSLESAITLAQAAESMASRRRSESPGHAARGVARMTGSTAQAGRGSRLTPREREVAGLVAQGLSNRRIATELLVTEATAAKHVEHILVKLGFTSRVEIVAWMAAGHPVEDIRS
jgi:non-specific serine/threonine protein kinase